MVIRALVALVVIVAAGCPRDRTVGFDPATNRCREFDVSAQKFTGAFLPDRECAGEPTPHEVPK